MKKHWGGVFIELAIVIVGVFIGLQVNNWNQARADVSLGQDYVKRLTRDLQENLTGLQAEIAYYSNVLQSVQRTDELLRAANPDPRALVVNAYRASELIYNAPVRATWDQIVSSGHLGLLPVDAAESGLSLYYAFDTAQDVYRAGLNSAYRETARQIIPMTMQAAMRAGCSDVRDARGNIVGFTKECDLQVDPAALKEVAAALRSNPAILTHLQYQYSFAVSATLNLGGVENNVREALAALGAAPKAAAKTAR
ncbi:MAG TPA: hypothetical protein VGL24_04680 [Chthoniobacterales bacterium]